MKKLVLLLLLVCTCATLSWAQSGKRITVTGSVIDGDDKSPVGQATVQLLSLPDSTMVVGNKVFISSSVSAVCCQDVSITPKPCTF